MPDDEADRLSSVKQKMGSIYGSTKVCSLDDSSTCYDLGMVNILNTFLRFETINCNVIAEPGLSDIMAKSTNYTERLHVWTQWRALVGRDNIIQDSNLS